MDKTTKKFLESIKKESPELFKNSSVLEVGSRNINGTTRDMFADCEYHGVDIFPGKDVDITGHLCDISDKLLKSYDIVLCMNVLEHDQRWRETLVECCNRVKNNGKVVIVCPTKISLRQFIELEKSLNIQNNEAERIKRITFPMSRWTEKGGFRYSGETHRHLGDNLDVQNSEFLQDFWVYINSSDLLASNPVSMRPHFETGIFLNHNVHMTSEGEYYSNPTAGEMLECLTFNNLLKKFKIDLKYSFETGFQACMSLERKA
jgi:SAM-dependent methyltransferase